MRQHSKLFRALLKRYHSGEASPKEADLVDQWYDSFSNEAPKMEQAHLRAIRNEMHKRIRDTIHADDPAKATSRKLFPWRKFAVAASMLLAATAGYLLWQTGDHTQKVSAQAPRYVEVMAERGKLKKLVLPDQTEIWLNAGSKLGLVVPFGTGNSREVTLVEGEAFFQVTADPDKPFTVHAADIDSRVLGTSFTISAYQNLNELRVSVSDGKVQVSHRQQGVLGTLRRGEEVVYDKASRQSTVRQFDRPSREGWITGTIYLSEVSFAELAMVCQNTYGIQLKAASPAIAGQRYSIQIDRSTKQIDLLNAVCAVHRNHYRKEENVFVIY